MGTSSKSIHKALIEVADIQGGFFTAKQAVSVGYADSVHNYHVKNGDWVKEGRGVYGLVELPKPDWPELVVWSLWSRGREDVPQGIYCMETALAIHGFVEKEGEILHMAVPTNFRRNSEIPQQLKLYKQDLHAHDVEKKTGFLVTTLERTVMDIREKCTNPKILKIIEAALLLKPEADRNVRSTQDLKAAECSDRGGLDRSVMIAGPISKGLSYNDIINAGED